MPALPTDSSAEPSRRRPVLSTLRRNGTGLIRTSTHILGRALLNGDNAPLRARQFGRFVICWDGKPGDYIETVSTEEVLGDTANSERPDRGTRRIPSHLVELDHQIRTLVDEIEESGGTADRVTVERATAKRLGISISRMPFITASAVADHLIFADTRTRTLSTEPMEH